MRMAGDPWQELMKRGRFEDAWEICDRSIRQRHGERRHYGPRHFQNIWNGAPLAGRRVLIRCYHGLGDTLQFLRYVPLVKEIASETMLWIQPALLEVVRPALPGVRLFPLHDGSPGVSFDVDIEIMELPHAFRTTIDTIPPVILPTVVAPGKQRHAPSIGLQWTAGDWNHDRNLSFAALQPLINLPGIRFVPLQEHLDADEQEHFAGMTPVDVFGVSRQIADCDLIITVDTMVAHLAGSLGATTWTLLKHDADWRWLSNRDDTPWYPSMRLYRQQTAGDWRPVVARVCADVTSLFELTVVDGNDSRPSLVKTQDAD